MKRIDQTLTTVWTRSIADDKGHIRSILENALHYTVGQTCNFSISSENYKKLYFKSKIAKSIKNIPKRPIIDLRQA